MAGPTLELVLLSSSPPPSSAVTIATPPNNQQRVSMSTFSPAAPSPSAIPRTKTISALKSGSKAAPVPKDSSRGFATSASLVKSDHFGAEVIHEPAVVQHSQLRRNSLQDAEKAPKKPQKRVTKTAAEDDGAEPKPKKSRARKPKTNKDEHMQNPASRNTAPTTSLHFSNSLAIEPPGEPTDDPAAPFGYTKSGKPRKRRAPKEKSENGEKQTTIPKAKITKPRSTSKSIEKKARIATEAVSSHFTNGAENTDVAHGIGADKGLGTLVAADDDDSSIWDLPTSPRHRKAPPKQKRAEQALDLEKADSRRRDWTPTKDTGTHEAFTESAGKENHSSISHEESVPFPNLISDFSYTHLETEPLTMPKPLMSVSTGVTKKRRVELVDVPGNQGASRCNISPEKGKAPKKKPRTITDFVTDQYAAPKETAPKSSVTSDFFTPCTMSTTAKVPLNDVSESAAKKTNAKPPRKRASLKSASGSEGTKPKSKKASSKAATKPKLIAEKLLSPTSALLKIGRQNLMFGTSSQLALEESPTLIRHIQQAIKQSEQDADILQGFPGAPGPPLWPRLGKVQGRRRLWAASARGDDGQLLEKLDDVYIPAPDRTDDLLLLMDGSYDDDPNTSFTDIDDIPIQISSDLPVSPEPLLKDAGPLLTDVTPQLRNEYEYDIAFDDIDNYKQAPPPSNQKAESSFLDIDDFPTQSYTPSHQLLMVTTNSESSFLDIDDFSPQSPLLPPNKLSSMPPPATISTSSPKKRRGPPTKSRSAIPAQAKSTPTEKPPFETKVKMPMSAPARPSTPKCSKGRFADIEEILDSEDDEALSPTPPRINRSLDSTLPLVPSMPPLTPKPKTPRPATKAAKSRKPSIITPGTEDAETPQVFQVPLTQLEWASSKSLVFKKITAAIRTLPPTTTLKEPSWHEKILLYDAIILEDFTAFLSKETRVRAYRRATQKQIKAWNKVLAIRGEKGLPEVGLGIAAKVGDEGEELINVVEKEIEVWMVKQWCQEMSVCGISKVKGGRSGMGKGLY